MNNILLIETATPFCSVALSRDGVTEQVRQISETNAHARVITIFIDEVLKACNLQPADLSAVAVSMGPGSYTGLRIGVSAAKGLCYPLELPLIAISTLQAMAWGMAQKARQENRLPDNVIYCPLIDARRMEVYTARYNARMEQLVEVQAVVIDEDSLQQWPTESNLVFAGDGMAKAKPILQQLPRAIFVDDFTPSATYMAGLAQRKFENNDFENLAYCEPFYLKEFKAAAPNVKGLR
ncbi:MAG: tRNA (adenosine(37)-N6)-threonylcarbamoyltransferase complex dimerization subunit type 1 TsaB [Bacteroidales bacterium]|nr:tRNA (adenosine(37)-N6)-threonylcarbamoyltransferase complex dimerization subunit type 1 TsaB [Bacteroidales bacterium]NLO49561.1 tRNA (adenosine(37)-N6)-threonylcarbamoyltransferase complex dimerization subunit type 1 TsaB [Bacteroidales bacterium]